MLKSKKGASVLLMMFEVLVAGLFIFIVLAKVSDIGDDLSVRKERAAKDNALLADTLLAVPGELNLNYPEDQLVIEFRQDEADAYASGDVLLQRKAFRFVPDDNIIIKESKIERESTEEVRFSLLNVKKIGNQIAFGEDIEIGAEACAGPDTKNAFWNDIDFQIIGKKELIGDEDYKNFVNGLAVNFRNYKSVEYFDEPDLGFDFVLTETAGIKMYYSLGNKDSAKLGKLSCVLRKKLAESGFENGSISITYYENDDLKRNFAVRIELDKNIVYNGGQRGNFVSAFNNALRDYYG